MKVRHFSAEEIRAFRLSIGLTQEAFWSPMGIHQSRASRYERGWPIPEPEMVLLNLVMCSDEAARRRYRLLRRVRECLKGT